MSYMFSDFPGPNERQLKRKLDNPLFESNIQIDQFSINGAREADAKLFEAYISDFQSLVQQAANLDANTDSEIILDIKERLDQSFTLCCALPGENSEFRDAINKLLNLIMVAVRKGAANDPVALEKLDEEDIARNMHQQLQHNLLVVDLMLDDSPIATNELMPTLFSETEANLQEALVLFDPEQLAIVCVEGRTKLEQLSSDGVESENGRRNLHLIETTMLDNLADKND